MFTDCFNRSNSDIYVLKQERSSCFFCSIVNYLSSEPEIEKQPSTTELNFNRRSSVASSMGSIGSMGSSSIGSNYDSSRRSSVLENQPLNIIRERGLSLHEIDSPEHIKLHKIKEVVLDEVPQEDSSLRSDIVDS